MKVLCFTRYGRLGASSRLRSLQYIPYLRRAGIDVSVAAPLLNDEYLAEFYAGRRASVTRLAHAFVRRIRELASAYSSDLVWIEKELFPWLPAFAEAVLAATGVRYVVDFDDAIFHNYDRSRSRVVRRVLGRKIDRVMAHAALVIAGNAYLAARARRAGARRVAQLPTVIDLERYQPRCRPITGPFRVGWIGSPVTITNLMLQENALRSCIQAGGSAVVVGGPPEVGESIGAEVWRWTEDSETDLINTLDVGIMPLADDDWSRGKCGYKLIQYMACAIPVIASPVGVNAEIVEHGVTGFIASCHDEWVHYLEVLKNDVDLRLRLGAAGRRRAEQRYSVQACAPTLASLLRSAAVARKDGDQCAASPA